MRELKQFATGKARRLLTALAAKFGIALVRTPAALLEHREAQLGVRLEYLIADHMERVGQRLFFLQIGAFDGLQRDPLHRYIEHHGWRGILVEPQRTYFERLAQTYAGRDGLELRNVAVAGESGRRTFYRVRDDAGPLPEWVPQLASFDIDTILAHEPAYPGLRSLIVAEEIECVTTSDLLREVEHLDLLQIDVEGYDAEVIRTFDFDRWQPPIVQFEHVHLSVRDYEQALQRLISYGYRIARERGDTMAYRTV